MDAETALSLLKGRHFDMEERIKKGIWPHPPLLLNDLIKVIVDYFKENECFPTRWIEKHDGDLIDDVSVIEKKDNGVFIYRSRRAHPINFHKIDRKVEKIFKTSKEAAEYYLRNDLRLPGDLDGWKVVKS